MIEVTQGKKYKLTAPYIVNGIESTIVSSQAWTILPNDLATLEVQADGSALVTASSLGSVEVNYTAKGMNSAGEVPLFGKETLSIVAAAQEPVQVTINVEEVI